MHRTSSIAERLDRAVDLVLAGSAAPAAAASAGLDADERSLAGTAARMRTALPVPPVAARFDARLGAQLAGTSGSRDSLVGWALRHPGRLIVTGAVGSAVGVGVTAAVWRTRRSSASRWLHR
jgi:hypothetical protein